MSIETGETQLPKLTDAELKKFYALAINLSDTTNRISLPTATEIIKTDDHHESLIVHLYGNSITVRVQSTDATDYIPGVIPGTPPQYYPYKAITFGPDEIAYHEGFLDRALFSGSAKMQGPTQKRVTLNQKPKDNPARILQQEGFRTFRNLIPIMERLGKERPQMKVEQSSTGTGIIYKKPQE